MPCEGLRSLFASLSDRRGTHTSEPLTTGRGAIRGVGPYFNTLLVAFKLTHYPPLQEVDRDRPSHLAGATGEAAAQRVAQPAHQVRSRSQLAASRSPRWVSSASILLSEPSGQFTIRRQAEVMTSR